MPNEALNPILHARDRLFRVLFFKISLLYARTLSPSARTFMEFVVLTKVILNSISHLLRKLFGVLICTK